MPDAKNKIITALFVGLSVVTALAYVVFPIDEFLFFIIFVPTALAIIISPRLGFYLFILAFSTETVNIFFLNANFVSKYPLYVFVLAFLLVGSAFATRPGDKFHFMKTPLSVVAAFFFFFELQGLLWAPNAMFGAHNVVIFAVNIVIFYLILQRGARQGAMEEVFDIVIVSGLITAAFLFTTAYYDEIEKVFLGKTMGYSYGLLKDNNRLAGLGGVNQTGGYLSAIVFICIAKVIGSPSRLRRLYYSFAGLFMAIAMFMTSSRGTIIGFAAGVLAFILLHEKGRTKFIVLTALFTIAIPALMLIAKPQFVDRLLVGFGYQGELIFSEAKKSGTTESKLESTGMDVRMQWWRTGFDRMVERPHKLLFGLGPGGFVYYTESPEVHSFFLAMFYDIGLFGVLLFLAASYMQLHLLVRSFASVNRGSEEYLALIATTAIVIGEVCVHGLIEYEFTSMIGRYPWFYLALNLAVANAVLKRPAQSVGARTALLSPA
jgi:hypothetical protein